MPVTLLCNQCCVYDFIKYSRLIAKPNILLCGIRHNINGELGFYYNKKEEDMNRTLRLFITNKNEIYC